MTESANDGMSKQDAPTRLEELVGNVEEFFRDHWANQPTLFHATENLPALITEQEMWDEVDCGLLVRPYFTAFDQGVRSALTEMTKKRKIVGHDIPGYINGEQIKKDFAAGGTFKFNQAEHWHPRIRSLVKGLEPEFRGGLEAYIFLSPPGKTAIQAHMDGSHVLVLQVAGVKDWHVARIDEDSISDSTRYEHAEIPEDKRMDFTLHPGDVLYMPHGTPHYAQARSGNSIHVAITIEEPTTKDLADVFLSQLLTDPEYVRLEEEHHRQTPSDKLARVRDLIATSLAKADSSLTLKSAVRLRAEHHR